LRGAFTQHCEAARRVPLELIGMTSGRSLMIFDVEGTLVDSTGLTLRLQETLQSFGFEFPLTTLQRHSGQDPHDMLHELLPGPHVTRVRGRIIEMHGQLYREKYLPQVTAFADVRPLFERVKRARARIRRRARPLPFTNEGGRSRRCCGLRR
jgi:beta-phosphoglucomutase-like phosphatase (HAD superfamily)